MENPIVAPVDGKITEIKVKEQDKVATDDVLIVIE
jgi:biotin carboxyl carrier protein